MLFKKSLCVFLIVFLTLQLCAGDDEQRDRDCRDRGRKRRGDDEKRQERRRDRAQRRLAGERRKGRKRIPGSGRRAFIGSPTRTTTEVPQNLLENTTDSHHHSHHQQQYGINGNVGSSNGHHHNTINGNGVRGTGRNGYNGNGHDNNGHGNGYNGNGYNGNGNGYNGNGNGIYTNGNRLNGINGRPSYLCPAGFVRLGNACYLLSSNIATWKDAHFACRDLGSQLAGLETAWEDETIRKYLGKPELARLERWIGGMFNWEQKRWIWGTSGKRMGYQGFSRRRPNEDRQWHCVLLDPVRHYRWAHRSCVEQRHYICESPLQREMPHKDKNEILSA